MSRPFTTPSKSSSIYKHQKPSHAPQPNSQNKSQERICKVKPLAIKVDDELHGTVPGFLHIPQHYRHTKATAREKTAAILLSGSSGGVLGPSSIYPSIADKLASLPNGIPVLRLDYRYPGMNKYCVADVQAALKYLETRYAISRFVLVGWSFSGAPVFTLGGSDKRVVACAAVASQTAGADGIGRMAPKPVLLIHGTGDRRLRHSCSRQLFELYGRRGERELKLFEGDGHSLRKNAGKVGKMLCAFVMRFAGVEERRVVRRKLVRDDDSVYLMKKGGELKEKGKSVVNHGRRCSAKLLDPIAAG